MAKTIQRMIGAAKLDVNTYEEVEADESAFAGAVTAVVLAAVAAGLGSIGQLGLSGLISQTFAALLGWVIWAGLTYLIGTKLPEPQTEADMGQLLRTLGFAASPGILRVLGVIPGVGVLIMFVVGLWQLAATVVAVRQALDYESTGRAVGVCVIGWLVQIVVVGAAAFFLSR